MLLLTHKYQYSLNKLFNDTVGTSQVILAFEDRYRISDAKFVRYYLELFLGGGSCENPRENQVGGICFRDPTVSRA
jgi:hypothetical protein